MKLRSAVTAFGLAAVIALSGCSSSNEDGTGIGTQIFTSEYGKVSDSGYAVPAVPISKIDKKFHRQIESITGRRKRPERLWSIHPIATSISSCQATRPFVTASVLVVPALHGKQCLYRLETVMAEMDTSQRDG